MKLALATDHAGFKLKEAIKPWLKELGFEVIDLGAEVFKKADDYPDYVQPAARMVSEGEVDKAIIFGGSGQGEAMSANRKRGIRTAVYYGGSLDIVRLSREHNDANILSIGARFVQEKVAREAIKLWLSTEFSGDERHVRRLHKIDDHEG